MKKEYKELRVKLKDKFKNSDSVNYYTYSSVGEWVKQCNITPIVEHTTIICKIFGSVPYPYQAKDRGVILKYLKNNKYKEFKKKFEV